MISAITWASGCAGAGSLSTSSGTAKCVRRVDATRTALSNCLISGVNEVLTKDPCQCILDSMRTDAEAKRLARPLADIVMRKDQLDVATINLDAAVWRAKAEGATWEEIGDSLGITRQAAQQRFGGSSPE